MPNVRSQRRAGSFDFTSAIRATCEDIAFRLPEFHHIDMNRVAVSFCQTRVDSHYGIYASLTPLRFQNGGRTMKKNGDTWVIQKLTDSSGTDYLYLLYVYVPRFMDLRLSEKLETIVHELYHINPGFNGDLRRFRGRCFAHGSSQKQYDATVRQFVKIWLDKNPPPETWDYLRFKYADLSRHYESIQGTRIPAPKIIPQSRIR